ncbi:MAG: hypothetical protein FJ167_12400 [Gammaproteobacteria bacterium]|nr:hypothetical protein [Betaproteobacteria bacterium]MBM4225551.1 hypothetical protein [Gammaproteobacteria bacterium]
MESLDYWRLCDELSIIQAALLLVESDPSGENGYAENWQMHQRPHGYEAAKTAITNAFRRGAIKGRLIPNYEYDINGNQCGAIDDSINLVESRVEVKSLREWLETRGIRTGFFFPTATIAPDYLNPKNPRYAPKLAAAVRAWQSVIDAGGKHPKQALAKWLREHAAEFGMTDDEGKPNETGIEEAAKVANWQPGGGAPKTPGE